MREHKQILRALNAQRWSELQLHRRILRQIQGENRRTLGIAKRAFEAEREGFRELLVSARRETGVHREALAIARAEAQLYRRALEQAKEDARTLMRLVGFIQRFADGLAARRAA